MTVNQEFEARDKDTKGIDYVLDVDTVGIGGAEPEGTAKNGCDFVAMGEVEEFGVEKNEGLGVLFLLDKRGDEGLNKRAEASREEGGCVGEKGDVGNLVGVVLVSVETSGSNGLSVHAEFVSCLLNRMVGAGGAESDPCRNEVGGLAVGQVENFATERNQLRRHAKFIYSIVKVGLVESKKVRSIAWIKVGRIGASRCSVGPSKSDIETEGGRRIRVADPAGWRIEKRIVRVDIIPFFNEGVIRGEI